MIYGFDDFYRGKRILVTGHTGFKGSWLSFWLSEMGAKVVGYSLQPPTSPNFFEVVGVNDNLTSIIGDIRDFARLSSIIKEYKPEIVFHMAAQSLVIEGYKNPLETFETNIIGTINVLEAIRVNDSTRVFVNITSDKCYENKDSLKAFSEGDRLGGSDPYSSSKACSELVTKAYRQSFFNLENSPGSEGRCAIASVRAGNVIGGGDWGKNRLIPDSIRALSSDNLVIVRNPRSTRPWQHVLDPLNGYLTLAMKIYLGDHKLSGPWNFGPTSVESKEVQWVVEKLCEFWGNPGNYKFLDDSNKHKEATYLSLDSSKSKKILGWTPKWDVKKSLSNTVEWYLAYYKNKAEIREKTIMQIKEYNE